MVIDLGQLVATAVTALAPFMPFLTEVGKTEGQKLAETMAEKGGEVAWKKAQALWSELKAHFGRDVEVTGAAGFVAAKPDDETRQTLFAEVLGTRLKENPALVHTIFNLLGGQQAIQQVLAERGSWVENVTQEIGGSTGTQSAIARDDSIITNVHQRIQH